MINIAICDDDPKFVQYHRHVIERCLPNAGERHIASYTNGESLYYDISEDGLHFDLILLDIEMPVYNGMHLAKAIRLFLPDVRIIFVTAHLEYAIDAFSLSIFRYVPKNQLRARLPEAVLAAVRLIRLEAGRFLTVQSPQRLLKIPLRDILYIEKEGKNVQIVTHTEKMHVRISLRQVFSKLNAREFIYISRSCIVNMIHIVQVKNSAVLLQNDSSLAISRPHLQTVKQQLNAFWGDAV